MKKFRPFWSYSIEDTEQWLQEMAGQGLQFKQLQPFLRLFMFEQSEASEKRYLIEYKSVDDLYEEGGWQRVSKAGKWTVYEGEQPRRFSTRDQVFQRLRSHYIWATVLLALLFVYLNTMSSFLLAFRFETFNTLAYFSMFFVLFAFFLCGNLWLNKKYSEKEKLYLNIQHRVATHTLRKRRIGWMYVQFLTKKWLERMFREGYELDYVKGISFYFKPRESANMSYEILNEKPKNGVFQFYMDSGWEAKCLNNTPFWHMSIWAKPYETGEVKPQISYEMKERLKSMRIGLRNTSFMTVFFIVVMGFNLINMFNQLENPYMSPTVSIVMIVMLTTVLVFWLWFFVQSVYGYIQEKKEMRDFCA